MYRSFTTVAFSLALAVCACGQYVPTKAADDGYKPTTTAYATTAAKDTYKPTTKAYAATTKAYAATTKAYAATTKAYAATTKAYVAPTKGYKEEPKKDICHKSLARCAGAPNKPYFEYGRGCCSKSEICEEASWLGYGKFCLPAPPKCYKEGERCMGAENYAYVPYAPCCDHGAECVANKSKGWGSFCMKKGYKAPVAPKPKGYPKATEAPKTTKAYAKVTEAPKTTKGYKATEAPKYDATTAAPEYKPSTKKHDGHSAGGAGLGDSKGLGDGKGLGGITIS